MILMGNTGSIQLTVLDRVQYMHEHEGAWICGDAEYAVMGLHVEQQRWMVMPYEKAGDEAFHLARCVQALDVPA
jgi:hypothetical protein